MEVLFDAFYDILTAGFPVGMPIARKYQNVAKPAQVKLGDNLVTYHIASVTPTGQIIYGEVVDDGINATQNYADPQEVMLEIDVEGTNALSLLNKFRQYLNKQEARDLSKSFYLAYTREEMKAQNIPNTFGNVYSERAFAVLTYNYTENISESVHIIETVEPNITYKGKVNE